MDTDRKIIKRTELKQESQLENIEITTVKEKVEKFNEAQLDRKFIVSSL